MRTLTSTTVLFLALCAAGLLAPARASAQDTKPRPPAGWFPVDSSARAGGGDEEAADSLRVPLVPLPLVGSIDRALDSTRTVTAEALPFVEYRSLADILARISGAFSRDLASPGLSTGLTLRAGSQRSIAVLADGAPMNDPLTGDYNLALYPTEQIERIETVPATRSFLYAMNAAGGLINIVSKSKKAVVPQSRIRYSESAHGYGFVDGTVSQDIVRGLNVTAGAQHTTFEKRYVNSAYDAWSAHAKVRYNISNSVNAFASLITNSTELGLNGGVDPATPDSLRFEELRAAVVNSDAYEKLTRYDTQLGVAVRPAFDSCAIHTVTFFLSSQLREYRDEENRALPNGIIAAEDHRSQWHGVRWLHQRPLGEHLLDLGAEISSRAVIASPSTGSRRETGKSAFGMLTLRPADGLAASAYARIEEYQSRTRVSFGADGALRPADAAEFFGGYARSFRFPSLQESFWNDGALAASGILDPERHDLLEAGARVSPGPTVRIALTFYRRVVHDAIVLRYDPATSPSYRYAGNGEESVNGISLDAGVRISWLSAEARLDRIDGASTPRAGVPRWHFQCGAYFLDTVVNGHLQLKTGFRGGLTSGYTGDAFDQRRLIYTGGGGAIAPAGTLDFLLIARIGDAYIHLLWENLLGRQYVTTVLYPMEGRALRFGLSWDFLN